MPIAIACAQCDWKGSVKAELAGKKGKCPTCGEPIVVPKPGSEPDDVEAAAAAALLEGADDSPPPPPSYMPSAYTPERSEPKAAEPPARRKGQQMEFRVKERHVERKGVSISGGVMLGLAMMGGAALWFVLGMAANRIFIYPPILFVLGLIRFFKSLLGHED